MLFYLQSFLDTPADVEMTLAIAGKLVDSYQRSTEFDIGLYSYFKLFYTSVCHCSSLLNSYRSRMRAFDCQDDYLYVITFNGQYHFLVVLHCMNNIF